MFDGKKENADFLEEQAGQGFENMSQDDLKIPFLRIMQPLTPQLSTISGAKVGMFYNTVTEKLYGVEIGLIPIEMKKVWIEWQPNRGGLVAIHEPHSISVDQSEFSKWKYNGNVIQETYMYYCLVENHLEEGPIVFALSSTGIKHAKNWNTLMSMRRTPGGNKAPLFSTIWKINTVEVKNAQGAWYQIGDKNSEIKPSRYITLKEFKNFIEPMRETVKQVSKNMDYSQLEDQSSATIESTDY